MSFTAKYYEVLVSKDTFSRDKPDPTKIFQQIQNPENFLAPLPDQHNAITHYISIIAKSDRKLINQLLKNGGILHEDYQKDHTMPVFPHSQGDKKRTLVEVNWNFKSGDVYYLTYSSQMNQKNNKCRIVKLRGIEGEIGLV